MAASKTLADAYARVSAGRVVDFGLYRYWRDGDWLCRLHWDEGDDEKPDEDHFPESAEEFGEYLKCDLALDQTTLREFGLA